METPESEVFERIPWESLDRTRPDLRWIAYLLSAAILLGAVGVSIGRSMRPLHVTAPEAAPTAASPTQEPSLPTVPSPPVTADLELWAEADLAAVGVGSLELAAAATAEWFVVGHFTREGEERSFVDWSGPVAVDWSGPGRLRVVVAVRRLAAAAGQPYSRMPDEAWEVTLEMRGEVWMVVDGPIPVAWPVPAGEAPANAEWVDAAGLVWPIREGTPTAVP